MTAGRCTPWLTAIICLLWAAWHGTVHAQAALCRNAIVAVEGARRLPDAFLSAIGRVESGRPDPVTGALSPWPWTVNAEGKGSFFDTKAEAIEAVKALQARGVASIDVGCMQVNLMHHPEAFASLDQAFDPVANASFAGQLLQTLFARTGSWPLAAAAYHSQTPTIGAAYQQRVLAAWAVPDREGLGPAGVLEHPRTPLHPPAPAVSALASPSAATPAREDGQPTAPAIGRSFASASRGTPAVAGIALTGRGLAAYRAIPTALAYRSPVRPG